MKKSFLYSLLAALYIVFIVFTISSFSSFMPKEDNIFMPMVMLSLLVLSASIMGFLFLSEPLKLYIDGEKKKAVNFFFKTIGFFICFALIFVILTFVF